MGTLSTNRPRIERDNCYSVSVRYLHPDKNYAIHKILTKGRKKKVASQDAGLVANLAMRMHADAVRGVRNGR